MVFNSDQRYMLSVKLRDTARKLFWSEHDKDSYKCAVCSRSDVRIDVHHRDGDPFNNHMVNLIGVCHRCHTNHHSRQKRFESLKSWKESFEELGNTA